MKNLQKLGYVVLGAMLALVVATAIPVMAAGVQRQINVVFNSNISIFVDGRLIEPVDSLGEPIDLFVFEGNIYLPAHTVAGAFGRTLEWDAESQNLYIGPRPGTVHFLTDAAPAHQNSNNVRYTEFSALRSGGAESFTLGGVRYTDGITFEGSGEAWAVYNLNGQFRSFHGVVGHLDGAHPPDAWQNATIQFFADGRMVLEVPISGDMIPREVTIDLTGVNQLRIEATPGIFSGFGVGIGNPVIE